MKTLYICYFGLREPLVQTQVLPYLRELSKGGIGVNLLTFEQRRWGREEMEAQRARLEADGIRWFSLPYHKRPSAPATAYDILNGARFAARLARRERIDVLHARAHVPMAMALVARRLGAACRLVFDIRGLMAEEYADAGIWTENSPPFRAIKRVERAGIRAADQVIVLTRAFRDWLVERKLKPAGQLEVVPCCVDLKLFDKAEQEDEEARSGRFEVIYAGSVTGLYLLEEMGRFFLALRERRPEAYLRILTVSDAAEAGSVLRRVGLNEEDFWIGAVAPQEVPQYLRRASIGLSFRKPTFSQIAASPTKIPEYLAAGLPIICNAGIGDTDELLTSEKVGVVLRAFDEQAYREAGRAVLALTEDPQARVRALGVARASFDLVEVGGVGYRNVYRRISERVETGGAAVDSSEDRPSS